MKESPICTSPSSGNFKFIIFRWNTTYWFMGALSLPNALSTPSFHRLAVFSFSIATRAFPVLRVLFVRATRWHEPCISVPRIAPK